MTKAHTKITKIKQKSINYRKYKKANLNNSG